MFKRLSVLVPFALLAMLFAAESFAALSECHRHIPVSAHFYSAAVVQNAKGCELKSHTAFDSAQIVMVKMCASMQGRYRAEAQSLVCIDTDLPVKVSEGLPGFLQIAGVCTIEGLSNCQESAQPVFWGVHHD